jgi:hypothetical protein
MADQQCCTACVDCPGLRRSGIANTIFEALAALKCAVTAVQHRHCLVMLEERWFVSVDPLHDQIARLTQSVH